MNFLNSILGNINWLLGATLSIAILIFVIWCAYDCIMRRFHNPLHKWLWLAAILFLFRPLGALGYIIFGREQGTRYR